MADTKISALTTATTPLADTEVLPIVQSSTTKKISIANLTAGRNIAANDVVASGELVTTTNNARISMYRSTGTNYFDWASGQTLAFGTQTSQGGAGRVNKINFTDAGDIQIATAAKGVNFTANTPAAGMTSQLLNWYEEGTWTPSVGGDATYTVQSGHYTRIGRQVTVRCDMAINVIGTGSTKYLTGLPFAPAQSSAGALGYFADLNGTYVVINPLVTTSNNIIFETMTAAGSVATDETAIFKSGTRVIVTATYFV